MNILPKKEAESRKKEERRLAIDEGAKLAKKVDALREAKAKEEANLAKFRAEATATVKAEIASLIAKKGDLEGEIRALSEEKATLQVPLDAEWAKVRREREGLDQEKEALVAAKSAQMKAIADLQREQRAAKEELDRASDERTLASRDRLEADAMHKDASEALSRARDEAQVILSEAELREARVRSLEVAVATREVDVNNKEAYLRQVEKEQDDRDRALRDRYETLLRTEQRIHGKRGKR